MQANAVSETSCWSAISRFISASPSSRERSEAGKAPAFCASQVIRLYIMASWGEPEDFAIPYNIENATPQ